LFAGNSMPVRPQPQPRYGWHPEGHRRWANIFDGPILYLIVIGFVIFVAILGFFLAPGAKYNSYMSKCVVEHSAQRCHELYYWTES